MSSKEYFDKVAQQWDEMRASFFSEAVREKAFAVAGPKKGEVIADIGAGTGFITEGLVRKGLKVIAVDRSEIMLENMRTKFSGIAEIDYRLGEAEQLPICSESVDCAFANMFLHHVETPSEAIKEIARILKPGGRLVLTDLDEHHFDFLRTEHCDRWPGFRRQDVQQWFSAAGLIYVHVDCAGQKCCTRSIEDSKYASISIFVASGRKPQERAK